MAADSYISEDLCFFDILKPMVELKKVIERKGSFDDLIVIADLVSNLNP